jgi:hypothetical protein
MCIVYLIFMLGMLGIGAFSLSIGNPERLVYATDYEGNVCGSANGGGPDYTSMKRAVYPRINQDMLANAQVKDPRSFKFYAICIEACPKGLTSVCNYDVEKKYTTAQKDLCLSDLSISSSVCNEIRSNCWTIPIQQTEILFRCLPLTNLTSGETTKCLFPKGIPSAADPRCVLAEDDKATLIQRPAQKNYLFDQLSAAASLWGRYFADLVQASWVILVCAIVLPIVLSFGFIKFLQNCTGVVVWAIIYLTMVVSIVATVAAYLKAGIINPARFISYAEQFAIANGTVAALDSAISGSVLDASANNSDTWRYVAYVMTAVTILLLVVLIAIRKQIAQSIDIITLGADAINAMPLMVFFPLLTVATLVAFLFWWIYVAANLMSAGTAEEINSAAAVKAANIEAQYGSGFDIAAVEAAFGNSTSFTTYSVSDVFFYLQIYHVFGLLWTNQFIQAISVLSISGAVSAYYFSLDGREKHAEYGELVKQWKIDNKWRAAAKTAEEKAEEAAAKAVADAKAAAGEDDAAASASAAGASTDAAAPAESAVLAEADILPDADVDALIDGHKIPRLRLFRKTGHRGSYEVIGALWRTIRKHMGTAAFGALLIAIVQMLRVVMAYFDKQLDGLAKNGQAWVAYIKWYINYCLWCLEQCVKFVTRNAFVYTALKGQGFCAAARSVFGLILRKAALLAFVNAVSNVIIFLGQLSIAVLCAIICWGMLENLPMFQAGGSSEVFSSWLPTVIVVLFAYFVAAFFFNTFDVAVDTMLIAYVTDMEECKIKNGMEFPLHYKAPKQAGACCCGICGCCGCAGSASNADEALSGAREHYAKGKKGKVPGEASSAAAADAKATSNPAAAGKDE